MALRADIVTIAAGVRVTRSRTWWTTRSRRSMFSGACATWSPVRFSSAVRTDAI
jgi:hypothetical protein